MEFSSAIRRFFFCPASPPPIFKGSYTKWEINGVFSEVGERQLMVDPTFHHSYWCTMFTSPHYYQLWTLSCTVLPPPGVLRRKKEKKKAQQNSEKVPSAVTVCQCTAERTWKTPSRGGCLPCRKGSLPGSKTQISASKNLCFQKL